MEEGRRSAGTTTSSRLRTPFTGCPGSEGVFGTLADPDVVARVSVNPDLGTVVWPSGADPDPVVLYAEVTGEPIELEASTTPLPERDR